MSPLPTGGTRSAQPIGPPLDLSSPTVKSTALHFCAVGPTGAHLYFSLFVAFFLVYLEASPLDEAAPTERGSVRASVTEQTPNKRDFVVLLFGCSVLELEFVPERGGTAMAHELVGHT